MTCGLVLGACSAGCQCAAPPHPALTGRVEQFDLDSTVVGDRYRVLVRLPPGYEAGAGKRYPVVVQLDATLEFLDEFQVTAGYASALEGRGAISEVVVVGVGYPSAALAPGQGRLRDYTIPMKHPDNGMGATGGAVPFAHFLRDELSPWLEQSFAIAEPRRRALFGHSLGGLFAVWLFTEQDVESPPFGAYVAASPSLHFDQGSVFGALDEAVARGAPRPVALSMTTGSLEGPEMNVYFDEFAARVERRGFAGLSFEASRYPTDHTGTVSPSFRDGLRFVFDHGLGVAP